MTLQVGHHAQLTWRFTIGSSVPCVPHSIGNDIKYTWRAHVVMHKTNDDTSTGSHHAWGSSCGSLPLILVYQHVPDNSQIREWKKSTKTHCIKGTAYSSSSESDLYWLWLSSGDLCSFVSMSELPSKVWNDSRSVTKYPSSIGL